MLLSSIRPQDVERYKGVRIAHEVSPGTINRELAFLRLTLNMAVKWGRLKESPMRFVEFLKEPPGRTRVVTEEELNALFSVMPSHLKAMFLLALNTGMRLNEIRMLKWSQIRIQEKVATITRFKSGKEQIIDLNSVSIAVLSNIIRRIDVPFVFYNPKTSKPWRCLSNAFSKACSKAHVHNLRFHDSRHTYATDLLNSGADLRSIMDLMGHTSMRMVQRYTHPTRDRLRDAVCRLETKYGTQFRS
jgi:integrase